MTEIGGYGALDRLTHRIAFASRTLQRALMQMDAGPADMADATRAGPPVFVAGLPRSGSTLVLEVLHGTGAFGSHTYRHMPFVFAPRLWDRIAGPMRKQAIRRERPHGDGMTVDEDSPEAFEEVLWKAWLPQLFRKDRIITLDRIDDEQFVDAFRAHVGSLCTLESAKADRPLRYLSKNNANIGRLPALPQLFGAARIIVPFRNPADQARSLMRQHERFLDIHKRDAFAQRYMSDLGHHEFGADLRCIDFDGWIGPSPRKADMPMWIEYWTAAYRHALNTAGPGLRFFDHDAARARPAEAMAALEDAALLPPGSLSASAASIRPVDTSPDEHLPPETQAVWAELRKRAKA